MGATTAERDLLRRAIILSLLVHLAAGANLPRLVSPHSTQPLVGVMQVISMPRIQDEAAPAAGQLPSNPAPEVVRVAHGRIAEGPAPVPASAEPTRPTPSPPALPVTPPIEETMALTTTQPVHALPTSPGLNPQSVSVPLSGSGGPTHHIRWPMVSTRRPPTRLLPAARAYREMCCWRSLWTRTGNPCGSVSSRVRAMPAWTRLPSGRFRTGASNRRAVVAGPSSPRPTCQCATV